MNDRTKLRVLLVEDSVLTAEQLRELMRSTDHAVSIATVTSAEEAFAEASFASPDVVVIDLKLREGSGFSVLKEFAARDPKPCMVVMTNYALPKYRELALLTGADYFLDKALDFKTLPGIIEKVATRSTALI